MFARILRNTIALLIILSFMAPLTLADRRARDTHRADGLHLKIRRQQNPDLLDRNHTGQEDTEPEQSKCRGDLNFDRKVDVDDLMLVIGDWGTCTGDCKGDVDGTGAVDVQDVLNVIQNWGNCE